MVDFYTFRKHPQEHRLKFSPKLWQSLHHDFQTAIDALVNIEWFETNILHLKLKKNWCHWLPVQFLCNFHSSAFPPCFWLSDTVRLLYIDFFLQLILLSSIFLSFLKFLQNLRKNCWDRPNYQLIGVDQTEDKVNFMNFSREASLPIWEPYGHHPLFISFSSSWVGYFWTHCQLLKISVTMYCYYELRII